MPWNFGWLGLWIGVPIMIVAFVFQWETLELLGAVLVIAGVAGLVRRYLAHRQSQAARVEIK